MHFSTAALAALLPALALGAPSTQRDAAVSMVADGPQWTIRSMRRGCNAEDTKCKWSFGIDTGSGDGPTGCSYVVHAGDAPASQSPQTEPVSCGAFDVTSGWSGQFGEGNGFTTLSVVERERRLIAWPAYTDVDLADGNVVEPDRSFAVQRLD